MYYENQYETTSNIRNHCDMNLASQTLQNATITSS